MSTAKAAGRGGKTGHVPAPAFLATAGESVVTDNTAAKGFAAFLDGNPDTGALDSLDGGDPEVADLLGINDQSLNSLVGAEGGGAGAVTRSASAEPSTEPAERPVPRPVPQPAPEPVYQDEVGDDDIQPLQVQPMSQVSSVGQLNIKREDNPIATDLVNAVLGKPTSDDKPEPKVGTVLPMATPIQPIAQQNSEAPKPSLTPIKIKPAAERSAEAKKASPASPAPKPAPTKPTLVDTSTTKDDWSEVASDIETVKKADAEVVKPKPTARPDRAEARRATAPPAAPTKSNPVTDAISSLNEFIDIASGLADEAKTTAPTPAPTPTAQLVRQPSATPVAVRSKLAATPPARTFTAPESYRQSFKLLYGTDKILVSEDAITIGGYTLPHSAADIIRKELAEAAASNAGRSDEDQVAQYLSKAYPFHVLSVSYREMLVGGEPLRQRVIKAVGITLEEMSVLQNHNVLMSAADSSLSLSEEFVRENGLVCVNDKDMESIQSFNGRIQEAVKNVNIELDKLSRFSAIVSTVGTL